MSRLLGIDHGRRRIGVAVADDETGLAFARPALRSRGPGAVTAVVALAQAEHAETVVVGLPRNMDGSEGPQAAEARAFGSEVARAGLTVTYVDERLTSWEAGQRLGQEGRRPARTSGELDSAAARLILQDYLDARRAGRPLPRPAADEPHDQEIG